MMAGDINLLKIKHVYTFDTSLVIDMQIVINLLIICKVYAHIIMYLKLMRIN